MKYLLIWSLFNFPILAWAQKNVVPTASPVPTPYVDLVPYQSQMWIHFPDGFVQTLSATSGADAFLFDKPSLLSQVLKAGSNFFISKNNLNQFVAAVVSSTGNFYTYNKVSEPDVVGGVYYTKKGTSEICVVDSDGAMMETTLVANNIRMAGGNYFIDQDGVLTTIRSMGMARWNWSGMISVKQGFKIPTALFAGGNYFVDVDGKVTTISSVNGFFSEAKAISSPVKILGGNYFVTNDLKLYGVDHLGEIKFLKQLMVAPKMSLYSLLVFPDQSFLYVKGDATFFDTLKRVDPLGKVSLQKTISYEINQSKVKASALITQRPL